MSLQVVENTCMHFLSKCLCNSFLFYSWLPHENHSSHLHCSLCITFLSFQRMLGGKKRSLIWSLILCHFCDKSVQVGSIPVINDSELKTCLHLSGNLHLINFTKYHLTIFLQASSRSSRCQLILYCSATLGSVHGALEIPLTFSCCSHSSWAAQT